ncbi:Dihydroxyacetone phosphate acyltransferase, putative [Perkinsus marinus ATCC 50983]|uniref:Dihydroxyacetone phosphate acyltransferase, putative n=1 Tax=Perkinsus marinus (strain ATCC 50983 / TXsc) TaxID=423536 RepID=C5KMY8_PERM5|nr:Dihydroxyacetone phosphate acyltransferase, putative [Perkinsus marinus ATCC 50983]EER14296.1 Dihydroxyacetone phosphate acyltransferase, putative [Perkinsus marinus ATCC 50983]|eukprot:XP_002782501.1 Dihydroxyacetone phosphate acyltransferase, putative [Perkinsus marinus ATCC 50983]
MPDMNRVKALVMNSKAVQDATHSKKLKAEAAAMLDRIMGNQRSDILRAFVIVLHRVFVSIYDRVLVNHDGLEKLKELNKRGAKVLLLPTHRSYIDFLVLSYICFYADIRLPFIATGDNFFSIVGIWKILQHSGAFFMKRSFNSETHPLYSIVFKTYIQVILEEQGCVEMFIEGARSRSGTMIRPPKVGLLRFATESAVHNAMNATSMANFIDEEDVYLVPISIGYSRVMEVDSLATELEGRAKVAESLARTVSALRYLSMNFGTLTVHIDPQPIRVSDVVKRWKDDQKSKHSPPSGLKCHQYYTTPFQQLAEEVADRLDANMPIHTTHLVAAILLWKRHDSSPAVSHPVMVEKVRWLCGILRKNGVTVILDDNNTSSAVSRVASLYVDHVVISAPEEETGEVKYSVCPTNPLFATLLLSYYRNQLIYRLGHEACLVLAGGDPNKLAFLREELLLECIPLVNPHETAIESAELKDFAVSLIGPVVECWWIVALLACSHGRPWSATLNELVSSASTLAKDMFAEGKCVYLEACSFDFAKKAVRGMEKRGCLVVNGKSLHVVFEKMHELLALLQSIKECPALPQTRTLSNSSEASCGVEEKPPQRRFFTQLRGMTLARPLSRSAGTSKM